MPYSIFPSAEDQDEEDHDLLGGYAAPSLTGLTLAPSKEEIETETDYFDRLEAQEDEEGPFEEEPAEETEMETNEYIVFSPTQAPTTAAEARAIEARALQEQYGLTAEEAALRVEGAGVGLVDPPPDVIMTESAAQRAAILDELDAVDAELQKLGNDPWEFLTNTHLRELAESDDPTIQEDAARSVHIRLLNSRRLRFLQKLDKLSSPPSSPVASPTRETATPTIPSGSQSRKVSAATTTNRSGLAEIASRSKPTTKAPAPPRSTTVPQRLLPKLQAAHTPTADELAAAATLADTIADAATAPSSGLAPLVSEGITLQELEA